MRKREGYVAQLPRGGHSVPVRSHLPSGAVDTRGKFLISNYLSENTRKLVRDVWSFQMYIWRAGFNSITMNDGTESTERKKNNIIGTVKDKKHI